MAEFDKDIPLPSDDLKTKEETEKDIVGWANEAKKEGEAFLRSQLGYDDIDRTIDYIMGEYDTEPRHSKLSSLVDNRIGKIALDLAAAATDIRQFWEYRTKNKKFEAQGKMANDLATAWWYRRHIDLKFTDTIKYALAGGTGYPHMVYNPETKDMDVIPEDPRDVLPIRPSSLISLQDALGAMVRRERTLNYVLSTGQRAGWKNLDKVKPDRDSSTLVLERRSKAKRMIDRIREKSSFWKSLFGESESAHTRLRVPSLDLHTVYLHDDRRNEKDAPMYIGEFDRSGRPRNNWSYIVEKGERIYPRGRMLMFTSSALLYDGPNYHWHGMIPIPKLTLDGWPWSWLGKPPLRDLLPLQDELNSLVRDVADHNRRVGRPGVAADKNALSRAAMDRIDTRMAGLKVRYNALAGKPFDLIQEPPLDPGIITQIMDIRDEMDRLSGVGDITNLAKLGQIPSTETIEKILESMTPIVRLRSRMMEVTMREFAMMYLSDVFQFYTTPMRIVMLGPYQGITFEDFDFDPGNMIPDFLEELGDKASRMDRAQYFLNNFLFHITPGSLLSSSEISRKLLYLQLARAGWVDIWTLGEVLGIQNMGEPPEGAKTIPERLALQNRAGLGMDVNPAGRKASGQTMPRIVTKES